MRSKFWDFLAALRDHLSRSKTPKIDLDEVRRQEERRVMQRTKAVVLSHLQQLFDTALFEISTRNNRASRAEVYLNFTRTQDAIQFLCPDIGFYLPEELLVEREAIMLKKVENPDGK
jgi:hypothetical protein